MLLSTHNSTIITSMQTYDTHTTEKKNVCYPLFVCCLYFTAKDLVFKWLRTKSTKISHAHHYRYDTKVDCCVYFMCGFECVFGWNARNRACDASILVAFLFFQVDTPIHMRMYEYNVVGVVCVASAFLFSRWQRCEWHLTCAKRTPSSGK